MAAFQVDIGEPATFIMLNSAARYVAIAVGMVFGIWIFRTFHSILTVLLVRLVMDALDLYSGLVSGLIDNQTGVMQSCIMFIFPNIFAIWTLIQLTKYRRKAESVK